MSKKALKETIDNLAKLKEDISKKLDRMAYLERVHEDNYSYMLLHIRLNTKWQKKNDMLLRALDEILKAVSDDAVEEVIFNKNDALFTELRNAISIAKSIREKVKEVK